MIIAFLLHVYQPPQQNASVFGDIAKQCYFPLLKVLKQKKDLKLTLNIPLSALEWFEKEKMESFYTDLAAFCELGRVEFTGCAAYHPILTKIPQSEIERQIILNESGLSYYLGRREGFEGEASLMIKNVKGFFPPEMAFNAEIGNVLQELSYEWVMLDEVHVPSLKNEKKDFEKNHIDKLNGTDISVVTRNRDLSVGLAYKRDSDPKEFFEGLDYYKSQGYERVVIALDAETFGHHNKEGIDLLENIIDEAHYHKHTFATVSELVDEYKTKKSVDIVEASWGASDEDMKANNPYPKWYIEGNVYHEAFKKLEELAVSLITDKKIKNDGKTEIIGNLPLWDFNKVSLAPELNDDEKSFLKSRILIDKSLNSDKYWWSSKNPYFETNLIKRSLELFIKSYEKLNNKDESIVAEIKKCRDVILSSLKAES